MDDYYEKDHQKHWQPLNKATPLQIKIKKYDFNLLTNYIINTIYL